MHGQLTQLKQAMDTEVNDRVRVIQQQNETIARLQDYIKQQDATKNEILNSISRKGDMDKEKLNEETRRLNDKIHLITQEVTKSMNEKENRMKDELMQQILAMQTVSRKIIQS